MTVVEKQLPALPERVSEARHLLDPYEWVIPHAALEDYKLLVSEVATNVVRHGEATGAPMTVHIEVGAHRIHVEVGQDGPLFPVPSMQSGSLGSGWGLRLLDRLAHSWGIEEHPTLVWFSLDW